MTDLRARRRADELFSLLVRARTGACAECGTLAMMSATGLPVIGLECAHIISRRYSNTRVDETNAVALCHACHTHFTSNPWEWENWAIDRIGYEAWETLVAKSHDVTVRVDWPAEAARLRDELSTLTAVA